MILAEDGPKMSKSKGNVVTPDSVVERYGADSLRLYELFIAPFEQAVAWNDRGVQGCLRFLRPLLGLRLEVAAVGVGRWTRPTPPPSGQWTRPRPLRWGRRPTQSERGRQVWRALHKTVRKVTRDMRGLPLQHRGRRRSWRRRTSCSTCGRRRAAHSSPAQWRAMLAETYTLLLAPMAPHVAEEIWQLVGDGDSVLAAPWPAWDEALAADEVVTVVVQVNGKLRDRLEVPVDAARDDVLASARAAQNTRRFLEGKQIVKEIYVPGKLVNFVVR